VRFAGLRLKADSQNPEASALGASARRTRTLLLLVTAIMVMLPIALFLAFGLKTVPAR